MKIVYLGTYGPRQCGIATFTGNKLISTKGCDENGENNECIVVAMNDRDNFYEYPEEVQFTISKDKPEEYIKAAAFINDSGADILILEHEFGIFGGRDGAFVLSLLHRINIPFISVFHTVLKNPSYNQKTVTRQIAALAAKTTVMSEKAVEFLTQVYGIARERIMIIDHGIPDFEFSKPMAKKEFGLEGKKVLLTFGLISRNKGIETVLKAMPAVIKDHPDVVYLILGKTHPSVVQHSGEEYRECLKQLCIENNIEKNVFFIEEFADEKRLFKYLSATDIYVTPYLNEAQITSGTLSYAVGAGCTVVSTPYWHAAELLTKDKGRLFGFNDSTALAKILNELLSNPKLTAKLSANARAYGREVTWPRIGKKYLTLAENILAGREEKEKADFIGEDLPAFGLDHIRRMTDSTGLIQHAKFGIPNWKEGYCLDDNARALLMALMAYKEQKHLQAAELFPVYMSYIHYMQNENGTFRNFLSYSRNFLDENGSEDSFGRTIWALGYLLGNPPNNSLFKYGVEIFNRAVPNFQKLQYIRGIANTMIGLSFYLQSREDAGLKEELKQLTQKLMAAYELQSNDKWKWFEELLTYDNAVMPLALLHAGEILQDDRALTAGFESLHFLSAITMKNSCLSVIGNEKWFGKNDEQSPFAQQPIDAMMMVLAFQKAHDITGEETYLRNMNTCFNWFHGQNILNVAIYDRETKGCFDGLESYGVNENQGAESTLAYLISHLAVAETMSLNKNAANVLEQNITDARSKTGIAV